MRRAFKKYFYSHGVWMFVGGLGVLLAAYFLFVGPPSGFPSKTFIKIEQGQTLTQVGMTLKARGLVKYATLFDAAVLLFGGEQKVIAGEYYFPKPDNVLSIGARLATGNFQITPVRVVVLEGATAKDIAKALDRYVPAFDVAEFSKLAKAKEGYLFPDTYFFLPGVEPKEVLLAMERDFKKNIAKVQGRMAAFGKPTADVITMASLLEREAPNTYDRRVIAGILWKRISLGMPLQVDAVFPYITGDSRITLDDLKVSSPYNTYTHKGLPPGPIANPGLDAIVAAVTPIKTNYLYYLSDKHGNFHYAATYTQHLANKEKYISG